MTQTSQYNVNNWVQEFSEHIRNKQTMDDRIKETIIKAVREFDEQHRHTFRSEVVTKKSKSASASRKGVPGEAE